MPFFSATSILLVIQATDKIDCRRAASAAQVLVSIARRHILLEFFMHVGSTSIHNGKRQAACFRPTWTGDLPGVEIHAGSFGTSNRSPLMCLIEKSVESKLI